MSEKRDVYVQKLKGIVQEWDAEIAKLDAKAEQAGAEAKLAYLRRIEDLKTKRKEVEVKILEVQQASEGAWEDLKQGLENSWEILRESFVRAKSEFDRGYKQGREGK